MRKKIVIIITSSILVVIFGIASINFNVLRIGSRRLGTLKNIQPAHTILVLGASVYKNGRLSDMYRDRAQTALDLYKAGKAPVILVSGDNSTAEYDEVTPVKQFLIDNGVASSSIVLDYAGFDTYDSVYRARDIFGVTSTIIVTQAFHLPRALYIADRLGIDAQGVSADLRNYRTINYLHLREYGARVKAWWNILVGSKPKFLGETVMIPKN